MLNKLTEKFLVISFLLLSQTAAYALGENNSRLQYLLERAKARKAGHSIEAPPQQTAPVQQYQQPVQAPVYQAPTQQPTQYRTVAPQQAPVQRQPAPQVHREPVVIKTHPSSHGYDVTSPVQQAAPQPLVSEPVQHTAPEVHIQQETHVVQPPVQTYIAPPSSSGHHHTQTIQNSSIEVKHAQHQPAVIETHHHVEHKAPVHQPAPVVQHVEHKAPVHQPAPVEHHPSSHSYDATNVETKAPVHHAAPVQHKPEPVQEESSAVNEVTNYLDDLLSKPVPNQIPVIDLKADEQKQIIHDQPVIPQVKEVVEEHIAEPEPVKEVKEAKPAPVKTVAEPKVEAVPAVAETQAPEKTKETIIPEEEAKLSQKDSDYLLVIRKSLKSLEDDPWTKVKTNMDEALDYFDREQSLHTDKDLSLYHKLVLACKRFSEGGLELDEGDFADFEEAESLYLDTKDLLQSVNKELDSKDDYQSMQIKEIVNALLGYTEEELEYIEEMLGM